MDVSTAKIVEAGGGKAKAVSESKQQAAINYMEDPVIKARLNDIRRDLYMGGIKGLVQGVSVGSIAIYCTNFFPSYKKYYNKNNFLAAVLITGAIGSFVGSLVEGKNSVQYVGDIFKLNSRSSSSYVNQLNDNERDILQSSDKSFENRELAIKIAKRSRDDVA